MIKKIFITTFILLGFSAVLYAQKTSDKGIEINLKDGRYLLAIKDGISGNILSGNLKSSSKEALVWTDEKGLECKVALKDFIIGLEFSMPGGAGGYRLLSIELNNIEKFSGKMMLWDGHSEQEYKAKEIIGRDKFMETFPLACVYDENNGVAIGITPDSVVSDLKSSLEKRNGNYNFSYSTKVVIDSEKKQRVSFLCFKFAPEFGWKNAVEKYYEMYPDFFKPASNVNDRIYGIGGYIGSGHLQRNFDLHSIRRMHLSWEWTYTPWQEAGRWATLKEDWKQGEHFYPRWGGIGKDKVVTWDEYDSLVKEQITSGNRLCAMLFYILVKDIRKELVDNFPESRMVHENSKANENSGLYSKFDQANKSYMAFAYGSGLSAYLENQLSETVKKYDISGFAFDMANSSMNDYSKAQLKFGMGRTFDQSGKIYTPDSVIPIPFAVYIKTLYKGNTRMASYMNFALHNFAAFTVFHSDAVMFEGNPDKYIENVPLLRLMSGQKPFTLWGCLNGQKANTAIKWDYYKNPEIKKHLDEGFAQLLLLTCLQYGASPQNWSVAYDNLSYFPKWVPTIISLKKAGWRCVSAVKDSNPEKLWIGRFGKGTDTIITISNPSREDVKTDLQVLFKYMGDGKYFFVSEQGQLLKQNITSDSANFSVIMKPKEIMVLRTVSIEGKGNLNIATVEDSNGNIIMDFEPAETSEFFIKGKRLNFHDKIITSNVTDKENFSFNVKGKNKITLNAAPDVFVSDDAKNIAGFFSAADEGKTELQPVIIIPDEFSKTEKTVSEMIDRYYPYVKACMKRHGKNWIDAPGFLDPAFTDMWKLNVISPKNTKDLKDVKKIYVGTMEKFHELKAKLSTQEIKDINLCDGGFIKLFKDDLILWLGGTDEKSIMKAANKYFDILDKNQH